MEQNARLHLPDPALGACVYLAVERDTRGLQLTDAQRFNYYPATPLPTISWLFEGELHMVEEGSDSTAVTPSLAPALPRVVLAGPHRRPTASWSPGAVHALTVGFYPEALSALLGLGTERFRDAIVPLQDVVSGPALQRLVGVGDADDREPFQRLAAALLPLWQDAHDHRAALPTLRGWVQSMAVRATLSKTGAGLRRAQRRFRDWTGQSHRDLQLFVRTEQAMARASSLDPRDTAPDLASLAAEAGFADQSHMGREVRRVTGLSPRRLGDLMETEEAFWFYRLLSGHLRDAGSHATLR